MSKIPQGEWNAIAARYAQGESITRIAQSYGCTPPAIHYILKRSKQRAAPDIGEPPGAALKTAPPPVQSRIQTSPAPGSRPQSFNEGPGTEGAFSVQPNQSRVQPFQLRPGSGQDISLARHESSDLAPPAARPSQPPTARNRSHGSAFTAGLDDELHGRAEAAVAAFLSSFDAALAEGSPHVRKQLRDAATDLMRVAARTTIVLDRLNANAEHAAEGHPHQLREERFRY